MEGNIKKGFADINKLIGGIDKNLTHIQIVDLSDENTDTSLNTPESQRKKATPRRIEATRRTVTPKIPENTNTPKTPKIQETPDTELKKDDSNNIVIKEKRFLTTEDAKTFMKDLDLETFTDGKVEEKLANEKKDEETIDIPDELENPEGKKEEPVGLSNLLIKYEQNNFLTPEDIKVFMHDLELPLFRDKDLLRKMRNAGATQRGFEELNDLFAFIQNECKRVEGNPLDSFHVFDRLEGGVIDEIELRRILSEMGDGLLGDDVDKCIEMADLYGDGSINYEKVLKQMEELQYPLKESGDNSQLNKLKSIKSCWI